MRGFPKSASSILAGGSGNRLVKTNASGLLAESGIIIDGGDNLSGIGTLDCGVLTAATNSLIGGGGSGFQRLKITNTVGADGGYTQLLLGANEAYGAEDKNNWTIVVNNRTDTCPFVIQTRGDSPDYDFIKNILRLNRTGNIDLFGDLLWDTDGGGDIGAAADNRPDFIYAKNLIRSGGGLVAGTTVTVGGGILDIVGPPTTATPPPNAKLVFFSGATYQLQRFTSSARYKENISPTTMDTSKIYDLELKQFQEKASLQNYNEKKARAGGHTGPHKKDRGFYTGLIAEEVYEVNPAWTTPYRDLKGNIVPGEVESVDYQTIALCTLVELKKLKERVDLLEV